MPSMIDFPGRRVFTARECEQCGVHVPAGAWVAVLPNGSECCSSMCIELALIRDEEVDNELDLEIKVDSSLTPKDLRDMATAKDREADDLRDEIEILESEVAALRKLANHRQRIENIKNNMPALIA